MGTDLGIEHLCFVTPDGEEIPYAGINEVSINPDVLRQNEMSDEEWLNLKQGFTFEYTFPVKSNNWLKMHGFAMRKRKSARKRRTRSKNKGMGRQHKYIALDMVYNNDENNYILYAK